MASNKPLDVAPESCHCRQHLYDTRRLERRVKYPRSLDNASKQDFYKSTDDANNLKGLDALKGVHGSALCHWLTELNGSFCLVYSLAMVSQQTKGPRRKATRDHLYWCRAWSIRTAFFVQVPKLGGGCRFRDEKNAAHSSV